MTLPSSGIGWLGSPETKLNTGETLFPFPLPLLPVIWSILERSGTCTVSLFSEDLLDCEMSGPTTVRRMVHEGDRIVDGDDPDLSGDIH